MGYTYIQLDDLSSANRVLSAGLAFQDKLSPAERGKLLGNLGYVRALLGDNAGAAGYLQQAAALGNASAAGNLARLQGHR